ncbi:unnamed protein product [Parnassius mnemosyne]|uniref:Uncharacterized protein n=1 Tax=Parnassius mnemosyne TaxID=213953 RepID=A0AAV1LQ40_9NEOP
MYASVRRVCALLVGMDYRVQLYHGLVSADAYAARAVGAVPKRAYVIHGGASRVVYYVCAEVLYSVCAEVVFSEHAAGSIRPGAVLVHVNVIHVVNVGSRKFK